jgi:hypothetical protein
MPARQFITGGLAMGLLSEQEQHLVGRVRQVQEPAYFPPRSHDQPRFFESTFAEWTPDRAPAAIQTNEFIHTKDRLPSFT